MKSHTPLVIGHRGAAALYPENTLASFKEAFSKGAAQMIEFDIQASQEGIPVVIHDATLRRTTNGSGTIRKHSLKELQALDAGYRFENPRGRFPFRNKDYGIPTFEELLGQFPKRRLMVEIKDTDPNLTREIIRLIHRYKAEKYCLVGSLDDRVARLIKKEFPAVRRFLSLQEVLALWKIRDRSSNKPCLHQGHIASMPLRYRGLKLDHPDWLEFLHRLGIKIFFWTINDPREVKRLAGLGVDGMITDNPEKISKILNLKSKI
ncbi:MAG: glycerophosphodiester phosphodiesterase [Candidatus Omnitrophica bacterium]|nr:glycerophosphodiester phosphodiesterase [Candidatus Omnitrophota bacterium]